MHRELETISINRIAEPKGRKEKYGMSRKVESEFDHNGLKCVVIFTEMGHRCGYVGVEEDHPLYKVGYSDKSESLKKEEMNDITMDKAGIGQMLQAMMGGYENESLSPEMFFEVHGGITYAGGGNDSHYPIDSDLWWFGYDTAHYGDGKDLLQPVS